MFEETESVLNSESVPTKISYTNISKPRINPCEKFLYCDHRNFDSVSLNFTILVYYRF